MPWTRARALSASKLSAILLLLGACERELVVGVWDCHPSDAGPSQTTTEPIALPWSTGFESDFCDFEQAGGFCYAAPPAHYETVMSPVHSGRYAAAFRVRAGDDEGFQTRCVRQGVAPSAAYYGAWYFVPASASNSALWNLLHFRGGEPADQHGLWDVSLENRDADTLEIFVFDFLHGMVRRPTKPTPIPIGEWFHIELFLRRAADATGEVALYQDGEKLLEARDIVTDDTRQGQWYVGNLATGLAPADSILYVDDITIRSTR